MSNELVKQISYILYSEPEEDVKINAVIKDETIWLTQKGMSELFDVNVPDISKHLKNIYDENELSEKATVSILETVQNENGRSVKRNVTFYNLDAIISVGYRVNSSKATKFRIWATGILKEYIKKGFVLDDERLKQGETVFGKDYFRELLGRVRSIRASERRIWQQITDIFAECSIDYDRNSEITKQFYATVQNKFHYAITGQTAAEIVYDKADHTKEHMGLTTWKNSPFSTNAFFSELTAAFPTSLSKSEKLDYNILNKIYNFEESDKYEFDGLIDWSNSNSVKHHTKKNHEKTRILFPEVYDKIKDKDISVRYR